MEEKNGLSSQIKQASQERDNLSDEPNNIYSNNFRKTANRCYKITERFISIITRKRLNSFQRVLPAWKPKKGKPVSILRWFMTEWCNCKCPYCPQTHDRFADKNGYKAHTFDNHPLEKWINAFRYHSRERDFSLVITGGEPMLDRKNMVPLLKELTSMPAIKCIRIDTNASWTPDSYKEIDPSKIILMCTYHPSQVSENLFFNRMKQLLDFGYKIGMVNFVMDRNNFGNFNKTKEKMNKLRIPLHPNPLWDSKGKYSEKDMLLMKKELPKADYYYRTKLLSPRGKKCLFPALAYMMNQNGRINVGCHAQISGSFFDDDLPEIFQSPMPCPEQYCVCLDMYSFLEDVDRNTDINPLFVYSNILRKKQGLKLLR